MKESHGVAFVRNSGEGLEEDWTEQKRDPWDFRKEAVALRGGEPGGGKRAGGVLSHARGIGERLEEEGEGFVAEDGRAAGCEERESDRCGAVGIICGGGDGWLYAFDARGENGRAKKLWEFDCNPKESKYTLGGRADRNHIIGTPVVHEGLVYIAVGEDPEHGEGVGHLWCIDPTKRGDVSSEIAVSLKDPNTPLPRRREQAVIKEQGEVARPNPNSAAVWHYPGFDADGNGKLDFEETMHRTCGTVAIHEGLLFVADFSGLFHCLDVKTGKPHWTHDMLAASWGSPLIVDGKVYIGDEDGDITVFKLAPDMEILAEINMGNSVYSTPIVAGDTLYIANKSHLFAIRAGATPVEVK